MKYYAVIKGREGPKIYTTWEECNKNISGYSGAIFKSFRTMTEARIYLEKNGCIVEKCIVEKCIVEKCIVEKCIVENKQLLTPSIQPQKKKVIIIKKENPLLLVEKDLLDKIFLKEHNIIVFTDGSCSHQGTTSAKAGSGIYFPQIKVEHSSKVIGGQTNNRGELFAVILALRFITEVYQKYYNCTTNLQKFGVVQKLGVHVHLDSMYVIKGLKKYKNNVNIDLWNTFHTLLQKTDPYLQIHWIKELAHSGVEGNEIADRLAKIYAFA